ncbi:MAG: PAS domain-containing protein [Cyanobacteria bacterium J06554_11]
MPLSQLETLPSKYVAPQASVQLSSIFNHIAEHTPDIVFVKDTRGRYVMANDVAAHWLGVSVDEMLSKTDADLFPLEVAQAIREKDQQVFDTASPLMYEENIVQCGQTRTLSTKKIPWLDADNTLLGLVGICRDITDQKESAVRIQESEEQLRHRLAELESIYQTAPVGLAVLDDSLRFQRINQHLADINGKSIDAHLGRTVREVIPSLADKLEPLLQSILKTGTPRLNMEIEGETPSQPGVLRSWIESWYPLETADGLISGVNIVCQEITERKRLEEERDRFFELSRDMLAVANTEGYFVQVNSAWTRVLGYSKEEMLARPYLDFVHPEDREVTETKADELSHGEPTINFENRYRRKDGTYCWIEWSVMPFPHQNVLYAVAHDITHRKQAEMEREKLLAEAQKARDEAERANRIKDDFLAVLSHELRTPLNPILGWTQLLKERGSDSERLQVGLGAIERNARLQVQLVDDLLDISRILRGKLTLEPRPVDLKEVTENAIETVSLAAEAKKIQIETVFQPPEMYRLRGDATRLQQVLWNLLSNAIKFTPEGGAVTVRIEHVNNAIQLQVTDTGKGISSDFLPYVFEHFRQADGTTTRKFGGLGLGLAITSKILEMHGGTIAADSLGEGQGATFTVVIPALVEAAEVAGNSKPVLLQEAKLPLSGLRLLVIDDEPDSLEIARIFLEYSGAAVTAISSPVEALEILSSGAFDGIVCDIGMPDIDGYQLMEQVRGMAIRKGGKGKGRTGKDIPAIALTAYAGASEKAQALAAGFQAHIAKPVNPTELTQQVFQLCKASRG